jgi:hypothetical protein
MLVVQGGGRRILVATETRSQLCHAEVTAQSFFHPQHAVGRIIAPSKREAYIVKTRFR